LLPPVARVAVAGAVLSAVYLFILAYCLGQKALYASVLRELRKRVPSDNQELAPAIGLNGGF
jgi:hypothetical protein